MKPQLPLALWGAISALGILTLISALQALTHPSAASIITVLLNGAVLAGLCLGHRWAFIAAILFAAAGTVVMLFRDLSTGIVVFIINSMVIAPLIVSRRDLFAPNGEHEQAGFVRL